jgi:hypothetical protein
MAKFGSVWFSLLAFPALGLGQTPDLAVRGELMELRAMVKQLQSRVETLERRDPAAGSGASPAVPPPVGIAAPAQNSAGAPGVGTAAAPAPPAGGLGGTTVNFALDGYYGYNFNAPIGRVNLLRAYDVSSNSFSLNQAGLVVENAPDPDHGKRFGARVDLQFGQATETLQGNPANEPRPDIYRSIFQAYGTYVAPVGKGLIIDFGKWSSSIGFEGNYTKDQINYSRSLWFDYLPFYHMGLRLNQKISDAFSVNYWVDNGTQQSEAFNGYKDELFGLTLAPAKSVNWTVNYYLGQEHPDVMYFPNGGAPAGAPTQQGVPFEPVSPTAKGKLHIFDSYATWQATAKADFALEADWVIERLQTNSRPQETAGGAAYARYRFSPKLALAARGEYMNDRNGQFSGTAQSLKEVTLTADYKLGESFLLRWEWRRDMSNHGYFYTDRLGILANRQTTATVGLVWWFGPKQGLW